MLTIYVDYLVPQNRIGRLQSNIPLSCIIFIILHPRVHIGVMHLLTELFSKRIFKDSLSAADVKILLKQSGESCDPMTWS